jgi:hypothetical protein
MKNRNAVIVFLRLVVIIALGVFFAGPAGLPAQTAAPSAQVPQTAPKRKALPKPAPVKPVRYQLEPKAMEVLKAASDRLAAARTISFVAVEAFEHLSRQGAPLVYVHRSEVTLQRPDKLRVIQAADGPASEFYYDGKTMMAFSPAENTVAAIQAPPTIDAALEAIYRAAAMYFPFTDLIVADPYGDLKPGLKHAYYVGQSKVIGDTTTDIVAYNGDGVFAQMWVGTEDRLPRLIHAIYLDDPNGLRHNLMLSDWQLDAPVPADVFTSSKIADAKRIAFAHPRPEPSGVKPPARTRPPAQ